MKIIYITGESCQGKTYIADKLNETFGCKIIRTDFVYVYMETKQPNHHHLWQWSVNNEHKKDYLLEQPISDVLIIEGIHTCGEKERSYINNIFKPEKHILIRVKSPHWEERMIKRWGDQPLKLNGEWFDKNYKPAPITKVVENYEEALKFIEEQIYEY